MAKESSLVIRVLDVISKYSIYVLVFLLPILFLPWTSDMLDFNKQALLILLVFVSFFSWIAKVLSSGKLSINPSKIHIAVFSLFSAYLLSTLFSLDKYGSFWGWPRVTAESLLTIIGLTVFYFLISNTFSKKEIFRTVIFLIVSSILAGTLSVFQLLGLFLPFAFTKIASFNTIGLVGSLGMFLAVFLPLLIIFEIFTKKWFKIVFGIAVTITLAALIIINYSIAWWAVLFGMVLLLLFGMLKKDLFDLRWLSLPMFFLVLSLFFIILKPQISVPSRPIEISLNQSVSFNIALQTIKERPIFGSGPGTFVYDFSKYKSIDFNQSPLWNVRFNSAGSKALNVLSETGIFGFIAFLSVLVLAIFYGVKFILQKPSQKTDNFLWVITAGVLIAFLTQIFVYFLHGPNLSLDFVYFFLLASFIGLSAVVSKKYTLSLSSFLTLGISFVFTLSLIFGSGILILNSQRYFAEVNYFKGQKALAQGNLDQGISRIEKAVRGNSNSDIYLLGLSQTYLSKIGELINKNDLSEEEKKNIQTLINNSINAAKIATDESPNNVANWSVRGFIYQNLTDIVPGTDDWAITSYDSAIKLEPINPYYPTQQGTIYIKKALVLTEDKINEKNQILEQAKTLFEKAIQLKPDYSNAIYFLGLTCDKLGLKEQAIEQISKVLELNPNNEEVKKVMNNLESGRPALYGIEQQPVSEIITDEQSPEELQK